jgi:CheY-specific phosphatase CheX
MQNILKEAVKNYIQTFQAEIKECKMAPKKGFVSKITITGDRNYDIFVIIPKFKLDYISNFWFGDTNYEIEDLVNEIANLIIGNAKAIAQQKGVYFNISTPHFLGEFKNIEYNDILKFKFKNRCFYLLFRSR